MSEVAKSPAGRSRPGGEPRPPDRPGDRRTRGARPATQDRWEPRGPRGAGGPGAAEESRLARLTGWRNWNLPVKLGLVLLVPVIASLTLGVVVITSEVTRAGGYARADRIVELSANVRGGIEALQAERQAVAAGASNVAEVRNHTDAALAVATSAMDAGIADGDVDPVAAAAWSAVGRELAGLDGVRAGNGVDRSAEVSSYTAEVDALFAVNRVLATDLADAELARESIALFDLSNAREEVLYQQAVVLAGMDRGTMSVQDVTSLHGSEARLASRFSDFHAVAGQDDAREFTQLVTGPAMAQQSSLLDQAINQSGGMSGEVMPGMMIEIPADTWNAANDAVSGGLTRVMNDVAAELRGAATSLQSAASNLAGTVSVVLAAIVLGSAALLSLVARQLLRSIRTLRRSARDVATRNLPDAVERIRAGENVDPTVRPVPVTTTDEVGQLARAFDAVHGEALRLAVEQANLRANYSELFVNLSRRSQSLVQRQLRLIEQLERDEEDPEQLSSLFKLDHLATRMRRNNENLMVLSGTDFGRSQSQPVALADLLRAAVSEIEHYQRVLVQPPPEIQILGYAAGDLIRLVAELLDNATAFSAPESQVTLASHRTRSRAIVVDIVDHGIGMSDEELARANEQLAQPEGVEEQRVSRRMGMFVVSKLANRHGVRVRLHGGQDIPGLRVTVTLPSELIIGGLEESLPAPRPELPSGSGVVTRPQDPTASAMTVTIPRLPSAEASGVDLFAPLTDPESDAAPAGVEGDPDDLPVFTPPPPPEVTPIFDDILSVWFSAEPPKHAQPDADGEDPQPAGDEQRWTFAADAGWRAVDAVSTVEPAEFTEVGLPKRQPKAKLLPGSVDDEQAITERTSTPGLTPERARHRMAGFQHGVNRARRRHALPETPVPDWPADEQIAEIVEGNQPGDDEGADGTEANGHDGTNGYSFPIGRPLPTGNNGSHGGTNGATNGHTNGHALTNGARNGVAVADGPPTEIITSSGLPKRTPRNRRPAAPEAPAAPTASPAADMWAPEVPVQEAPAQAEITPPEVPAQPSAPEPPSAVPPVSPLEDTIRWSPAADDGWQAVRALADQGPAELTDVGLPRRMPRAKLLPGSVLDESKPVVTGRDPDTVRNRLSSFQRGVQQGRNGGAATAAARVETGFTQNTWENAE
ncbi:MAG TPA: nitrate- and nitrite sensing domain-containing protein [Pseudonocardiaceae bacterium]|nr:nitrate- and nitrite sensing domain-containing protein [Pseudonocardiaceae bacterium]